MKKKDTIKEYHENNSVSKSTLQNMRKSPAHYKFMLENKQTDTKVFSLGRAFHTLILEPELFNGQFLVADKIDLRTKQDKEELELLKLSGKEIISTDDFVMLCKMRDNVLSNKFCQLLLQGEKEVSHYWQDKDTGINCRCRPDCRTDLKNASVIIDLKSCVSADEKDFIRDCFKYGYDLQVAMYKEGVEFHEKKPHKFVFIAVEKTEPYAVNIIDFDEVFIGEEKAENIGKDKFREYIGKVAECQFTGIWYGYTGDETVEGTSNIPEWLKEESEG